MWKAAISNIALNFFYVDHIFFFRKHVKFDTNEECLEKVIFINLQFLIKKTKNLAATFKQKDKELVFNFNVKNKRNFIFFFKSLKPDIEALNSRHVCLFLHLKLKIEYKTFMSFKLIYLYQWFILYASNMRKINFKTFKWTFQLRNKQKPTFFTCKKIAMKSELF